MNKLQQPARARIAKPNPIPVASPAEKSLTGTEISSNKNASSDMCVTFFIKNYFVIDYIKM